MANVLIFGILSKDNFLGMVSMCAGSNDIYPWAAFVIGLIAAISFLSWHALMLKMKIDDPLDAVAGENLEGGDRGFENTRL